MCRLLAKLDPAAESELPVLRHRGAVRLREVRRAGMLHMRGGLPGHLRGPRLPVCEGTVPAMSRTACDPPGELERMETRGWLRRFRERRAEMSGDDTDPDIPELVSDSSEDDGAPELYPKHIDVTSLYPATMTPAAELAYMDTDNFYILTTAPGSDAAEGVGDSLR